MSSISKRRFWRCGSRNPNPIGESFAPEFSCAIKGAKRCWSVAPIFSLRGGRTQTRRPRVEKALFGPRPPPTLSRRALSDHPLRTFERSASTLPGGPKSSLRQQACYQRVSKEEHDES